MGAYLRPQIQLSVLVFLPEHPPSLDSCDGQPGHGLRYVRFIFRIQVLRSNFDSQARIFRFCLG